MVAWQASRRQVCGAQAGVAQAGVAQAAARWALRLMWRTWVGVVSLMRVPDEGGDRRVPDTSAKAENQFIFIATAGKVREVSYFWCFRSLFPWS